MKKFSKPQINSPEYWDNYYGTKTIDETRTLRQDEYMRHIPADAKEIIELGCGLSPFPILAKKFGNQVWGLDYAPNTIALLRSRWTQVNWVVGDATGTPFKDGFFDVVVAGEIIEHIEDPILLVSEMARICKTGGTMILSTAKVEFDDPEHLYEFDVEDLVNMFSQFGEVNSTVIESQIFIGRSYSIIWLTKSNG